MPCRAFFCLSAHPPEPADEARLAVQLGHQQGWAADLQSVNADLQAKDEHFAVIGRIAEVANGKNSQNITFHRFVLAALLEEVLEQASVRLREMSNNRYDLRRAEDLINKRRQSGLDLEVSDAWTGDSRRPVHTLSGGEASWPHWRWRSAWRMWSRPAAAAFAWTRCSLTRALGHWMPRLWIGRSAFCNTYNRPAGWSASSPMWKT